MRILIAEEHNLLRAKVTEHLRNFYPKVQISRAYNFIEAFDQVRLSNYDMILVDAGMSGLEGVEGLKILLSKIEKKPEEKLNPQSSGLSRFGLTLREREVLNYLFKGISNKEIASALDVQVVTIKMHLRSICRKLGAKNRTQAVLKAAELF